MEGTHLYGMVVGHGNFALQNMRKRKGLKNNNNGLNKDWMIAKYR